MTKSSGNDFKVFKADKKLQSKAGVGDVDQKNIERADNFAKENKVDYADIVAPILLQLRSGCEMLRASPDQMDAASKTIKNAVMDLKASAAVFHYPMISRLCSPLLLHLETLEKIDKDTAKILDLLYHIVSIVVKSDESDIGEKIAQELENTFISACQKIAGKQKQKPKSSKD